LRALSGQGLQAGRGIVAPSRNRVGHMKGNDQQIAAASPQAGMPADDEVARAVRVLAGKLDLRSLERLHILHTLAAVNGSRRAAVERLGISDRTLRNKLQQYRLDTVIRSATAP